jgi:TatD DNase family protein
MFIDTHCHLNLPEFDSDRREIVARIEADEIGWIVVVGIDRQTSDAARETADMSAHVFYAAGLHPNSVGDAAEDPATVLSEHFARARHPSLVGVGETGIDLYRRPDARQVQMEQFAKHVALARRTGLALIVHCRAGAEETMEVLKRETPPERVILHCFEGDRKLLEFAAARGYHMSFAGNLTYPKAADLRSALRSVPRDLLLSETDAPFLAPQSFRGRRCEPANVKETVTFMAAELGMELSEVKRLIAANAATAFGVAVSEV